MTNWRLDMRIPVAVGAAPDAGDAVLVEGDAPSPAAFHAIRFNLSAQPGHPAACACCVPRGAIAEALARAFRDRATGAAPFFTRIVVPAADEALAAAIGEALQGDPFTAARYRKSK